MENMEDMEMIEVKRPSINISKKIMEDLGIIVKTLDVYKSNISKISKEELKKRNEGFYILANKMNISNHLKKTKFCNIFIQEGVCNRKVCNFAHNMDEYCFPSCAFGDKCKINKCRFKHPFEDNEDYKNRIDFKLPKNIQ